jgi:hypothetical protein
MPPYEWLSDLLPDVENLRKLELIAAPQQVGIVFRSKRPSPAEVTRQGKQLLDWLQQRWGGWDIYIQQFPLEPAG